MLKHQSKYRNYKLNTEIINSIVSKTSTGRIMFSSKCAVCNNKKFRFVKEQESCGLSNKLEIKTPLSKIPLVGDILF